jgi:hypothetical protein
MIHYLSIAMCLETYGVRQTWTRLQHFIAFLTTIAEIAAKRNEGLLRSASATPSMRQQCDSNATAMHRSTAAQIQAPNLICAGTWNGKQDQKRDVRSGEKQHHWTSQSAADERRTSTTSPLWHNTPPDRLEHHSIDQPNTIH